MFNIFKIFSALLSLVPSIFLSAYPFVSQQAVTKNNLTPITTSSSTQTPIKPIDVSVKEANQDYIIMYNESKQVMQPLLSAAYATPPIIPITGVEDSNSKYTIQFIPVHTYEKNGQIYEVPFDIKDQNIAWTLDSVKFYYLTNYNVDHPELNKYIAIDDEKMIKYKYSNNKDFDTVDLEFDFPGKFEYGITSPTCECENKDNCYIGLCSPNCNCRNAILQSCLYISITIKLFKKSNNWSYSLVNSGYIPLYIKEGFDYNRVQRILTIVGIVLGVLFVIFIIFLIIRRHTHKYRIDII